MGISGIYESDYGVSFFDCDSDNVETAAKELIEEFGQDCVGVDIEATDSNGADVSHVLFLALRLHSK